MQTAKSPDEVKQFFQNFLFPVQFKAFDQANGWHIKVVEQFMQENNLVFKEKKDYNEMYINVTRLKDVKKNRKPGV
eukprot:7281760-Ditylum_brightwellii.AAC.1